MNDLLSRIQLFNTWVLVIPVWLAGIIIANTNKKSLKRAVDISWYRSVDKIASFGSMFLMILYMASSIFIELKLDSIWFFVGMFFVLVGYVFHFEAKKSFMHADKNDLVCKGIYKYSRNPMYTSFSFVLFGAAIASMSVYLAILWFLSTIFTHVLIIGEERYCKTKFGKTYEDYFNRVSRYFLFL